MCRVLEEGMDLVAVLTSIMRSLKGGLDILKYCLMVQVWLLVRVVFALLLRVRRIIGWRRRRLDRLRTL